LEISGSVLLDGDRIHFANLDATFATDTLLGIYRDGFAVLHFEDLHGTDVYAFFTSDTFRFIYGGGKSHFFVLSNRISMASTKRRHGDPEGSA
jgi:hypothetical protein